MARPNRPPQYLRHKKRDAVYARTFLFGREVHLGIYGSAASYDRLAECQSQWRARQAELARGRTPAPPPRQCRTVDEILARWWAHADRYYRKSDGTEKKELVNFRLALRPLARLCGHLRVDEFGPKALKLVRAALVDGSWMTDEEKARHARNGWKIGWCRRVCNRNLVRYRTLFAWAETEEILTEAQVRSLCRVRGLEMDELSVRESADRLPVPEHDLAATLPRLGAVVRAMVGVQLLTAARPEEITSLRPCDLLRLDRVEILPGHWLETAGCWVSLPAEHKMAHKKRKRILLFGPRAQEILAPFLRGKDEGGRMKEERDPQAFLFSPREAMALWRAEQRARRQSRVQPSQADRRVVNPQKRAGLAYTPGSYGQAIARACAREPAIPRWSPYRLRHNAATRLRQQFGYDVAQLLLGHSHPATTQIYVLDSWAKAVEAVAATG